MLAWQAKVSGNAKLEYAASMYSVRKGLCICPLKERKNEEVSVGVRLVRVR